MHWIDDVVAQLAACETWGYHARGPASAEPTAFAALALLAYKQMSSAERALNWLSHIQATDGSVGVTVTQATPGWPTGVSVLAWRRSEFMGEFGTHFALAMERAVGWILSTKGVPIPRDPRAGHDSLLVGWPWVADTHSWIEPTALHVMALKSTGYGDHPRTLEAQRLLIDRLLPTGGCNYGNTMMLGQYLRPHVQPSGICLAAVASVADPSGRIERTIEYLGDEIPRQPGTASLCFAILGLTAHERRPTNADDLLAAAARRTLARNSDPYKLALLALAHAERAQLELPPLKAVA